jgi:hypothetical protein
MDYFLKEEQWTSHPPQEQNTRFRISPEYKILKVNIALQFRVARFFLEQTYQNVKNITNDHKLYQTAINYTKWP